MVSVDFINIFNIETTPIITRRHISPYKFRPIHPHLYKKECHLIIVAAFS